MPLQATSGAASQDAFGGNGVAVVPAYIEDVFSTYLYVGNGATGQSINNGIDLSGKGGLVWSKNRTGATASHALYDTARGALRGLSTASTSGELVAAAGYELNAFNSNGFSLGANYNFEPNANAVNHVAWTFRKQPKFFDIVTYTGNGTAGRTVAHNLGSVPACIIVKNTSASGDWWNVYHRSLGATKALFLNDTSAASTQTNIWNNTEPTSTVFSLGTSGEVNRNGDSFVAYLFAHDAGGFGLTGTDNVISCGSFTTDGSGNFSVNLGYEPQWVMIKSTNNTGVSAAQQNWIMMDSMRGFVTQSGNGVRLRANTLEIESTTNDFGLTATGFQSLGNMSASAPFIYIAIRRGPMKVPTTGTSVYNAIARTGTGANANVTGVGFSPDLALSFDRNNNYGSLYPWRNRLAGKTQRLNSGSDAAEVTEATDGLTAFTMDGISVGADATNTKIINTSGVTYIQHFFKRAPSFMDVVCYTGTGSARTVSHNLQAVPELMIVKCRSSAAFWLVYSSATGSDYYSVLNTTAAKAQDTAIWNNTTPTASVFSLGNGWVEANQSGDTYVAYLFATCAGVSKVGSYTGTATTKQIDCGFTSGARYVLIKRTSSTGDWYVWDSTRGIVAGNDPYLLINSWVAEVTNTDYIDTYSAGFEISSTAPAAINASGGTFIFLAIA